MDMALSDLLYLDRQERRAVPKGPTRHDEKQAKVTAGKTVDDIARDLAWKRCKSRCENCEKHIKRTGDLLYGAHFHHKVFRSRGGKKNPEYRVLCAKCHQKVHGR